MNRLNCVLLSIFLMYATSGCEVGGVDEASALQSSALVTDSTVSDGAPPVTILGKDALMKRVAEKRRESPEFAAAIDGAYDGIAAGERSKVETKKRTPPRDSALEGTADDSDETVKPAEGAVPFSAIRKSGGLRARIHGGVDASDLEQPNDSKTADDSSPLEPRPFSF